MTPCTSQFPELEHTILHRRDTDIQETIRRTLQLPEVFVCANDFVAVDLIRALKKCGLNVPGDVRVTGFVSIQKEIIEPQVTPLTAQRSSSGNGCFPVL